MEYKDWKKPCNEGYMAKWTPEMEAAKKTCMDKKIKSYAVSNLGIQPPTWCNYLNAIMAKYSRYFEMTTLVSNTYFMPSKCQHGFIFVVFAVLPILYDR